MKKKVAIVFFASLFLLSTPHADAQAKSDGQNGTIGFDASLIPPQVVDPEKPGKPSDPGPSPSTEGFLRIDFVPRLDFGRNQLMKKDQSYKARAQLFHDDTGARGNFVQVTDSRATGAGWTLQVRQETDFMIPDKEDSKLIGSYISLDKSWTNSTLDEKYAPTLVNDVIKIDKIKTTYELAKADKGKGQGIWSVEFGASEENEKSLDNTLTPLVDENNQPILDPNFGNKQAYENSAVTFFVPGASNREPGKYQTVLTWILSELP
ncbi:WxL domain-containing protein [Candidatus Enterococcus mansonii]|uniref:WxL domain-containing protein n=1 Tax=Candidatus Enterococcus mansonii TaxID=1834181 RepID=A0A242CJR2_9ENTE|nr:WxL domain-containing protein [Enterococcus sp. 4G2_DIV0659]OTO10150.1 hypothetical protein A5880_000833 [Enterococcus sp. 4G2_DIV0659]